MKLQRKKIVVTSMVALSIGLLLSLILSLATAGSVDAENSAAPLHHPHIITVEVAEIGSRFIPDEAPVFEEDGMPAYGSAFVTQGYLYPEGTVTCDAEGVCNGVLEDGSPEFPDQVMGEWTCWGYHVGDGAHTETGPIVATTQMFSFSDMPGADMLTTVGYEFVDLNTPFKRAVTGGTGMYRSAAGEQNQELLGLNNPELPTFGVTLRVTFDLDGVETAAEAGME